MTSTGTAARCARCSSINASPNEFWQKQLGRDDLEYGHFGENFTVEGLPDDEVHIGDRYRIGEVEVEVEVTQPCVTCFRVGMRLGEPEMASLLVAHHRPGFYFRVITEGHVQASDEIIRTRIGPHRMSVATIDALLYLAARPTGWLRWAVDGSLAHGGPCTRLLR